MRKIYKIVLFFIISIGCFLFFYYKKPSNNETQKKKYWVRGVDVSHHNPILDWRLFKDQNFSFAYFKATEGVTHDDRNYKYNYKLAKKNGLRVGAYHFYTFGVSGKEQAQHFIDVANCQSGDLIPTIDVEHSRGNRYNQDSSYFRLVIDELKELEEALYTYYGVRPIIYTNEYCYNLYIKKYFSQNFIWISSLDKEPSEGVRNWIIWQYTHKGTLPNIGDYLDFNYFRYSYNELSQIFLP